MCNLRPAPPLCNGKASEKNRTNGIPCLLLSCSDRSYYVGHTDNLEARIAQHQSGELKGYTATRRPVALLKAASFVTRDDVLAAEMQMKGWSSPQGVSKDKRQLSKAMYQNTHDKEAHQAT